MATESNRLQMASRLLDEIQAPQGRTITEPNLTSVDTKQLTEATAQILTNILQHINAFEPTDRANSFFVACQQAVERTLQEDRDAPVLSGATPASAHLALIALNAGLLERRIAAQSREEQAKLDKYCTQLFETTRIGHALYELYRPNSELADTSALQQGHTNIAKSAVDQYAKEVWEELDPSTFKYLKAGTTSVIIKCQKKAQYLPASKPSLALKCVLYPWNLVPTIARDTARYAQMYASAGAVVVPAEASTSRWVLMPFQSGETLAEHLDKFYDGNPSIELRIRKAEEIALALTTTLGTLANDKDVDGQQLAGQHLDLSPSNVLVTKDHTASERWAFQFIDLGINHLYTRQIGIADHDDSVYVAPEVKNRGRSATSDVYSLAVILIRVLTGTASREGHVPDEVYEMSPALGRLLDDCLDEDARKRLLLYEDDQHFNYRVFGEQLALTFALVKREPEASDSAITRWWGRFGPASNEPWSLLKQLVQLHNWPGASGAERQTLYLAISSGLAAAAWWYIFAKSALFHFDALVTGTWMGLPKGIKLAAAIIVFCQGLTASKFYQTILARLTVRGVPDPLSIPTEVCMRIMAVVALPTAILALGPNPEWWAWLCAGGALMVALTNFLTLKLAQRLSVLGRDEQFSTVPSQLRQIPGGYEQWWWTMLLYALVIAVIAAGLQRGFLNDLPAYVFGLALISVGIHYVSKCVIAGPAVRGGLARAFTTGERLQRLHEQKRSRTWPGFRDVFYLDHDDQRVHPTNH